MLPTHQFFLSSNTLCVIGIRDITTIDNSEMFDYCEEHGISIRTIIEAAITVVNCRLRGSSLLMDYIVEQIPIYHSHVVSIRIVVTKCVTEIVTLIEPFFYHLYGQHKDPSTLLCIRGIKHNTLLLGSYRVGLVSTAS